MRAWLMAIAAMLMVSRTAEAASCCAVGSGPGCDDAACQACICDPNYVGPLRVQGTADPPCCDAGYHWDFQCSQEAQGVVVPNGGTNPLPVTCDCACAGPSPSATASPTVTPTRTSIPTATPTPFPFDVTWCGTEGTDYCVVYRDHVQVDAVPRSRWTPGNGADCWKVSEAAQHGTRFDVDCCHGTPTPTPIPQIVDAVIQLRVLHADVQFVPRGKVHR